MLLSDRNVMWIRQVRSLISCIQNEMNAFLLARLVEYCTIVLNSYRAESVIVFIYTSTFSVQITIYYLEAMMSH